MLGLPYKSNVNMRYKFTILPPTPTWGLKKFRYPDVLYYIPLLPIITIINTNININMEIIGKYVL